MEQLPLLLLLKMADQLTQAPHAKPVIVPHKFGWRALLPLDGAAPEEKYRAGFEALGKKRGMLGVIFQGNWKRRSSNSRTLRRGSRSRREVTP
ncbi:hypothetical protein [Methylibium sp.]|uniref:hypothetical protein n=1 Tax=Methylibium sp. TaxID=2067992 RepID=UPI0018005738|nr:hypothetical protein [Methylibium sp.]MBA3589522.1 hypothetical protein [Methylibium sp.]